jgi:hypothetical protein
VTVSFGENSFTTGLSNINGVGTVFEEGTEGATSSVTIQLPNGNAAMQFSQGALGPGEPYILATNSCVTYCGQVLRAGGVEGVPGTTRSIINFLGLGQ